MPYERIELELAVLDPILRMVAFANFCFLFTRQELKRNRRAMSACAGALSGSNLFVLCRLMEILNRTM